MAAHSAQRLRTGRAGERCGSRLRIHPLAHTSWLDDARSAAVQTALIVTHAAIHSLAHRIATRGTSLLVFPGAKSYKVLPHFVLPLLLIHAQYFDSKFIAQNDGREVTRVCSAGKVRLVLNVVTSGMKQYGYA